MFEWLGCFLDLDKLTKPLSFVVINYLYGAFACVFLSCHDAFQCETTLYRYLNVNELLFWNRRNIWSLSDYNGTRIHYHLVHKRTLHHLAKLAKKLSCAVSTYLYDAFDCFFLGLSCVVNTYLYIAFDYVFLSWHVRVLK